MCGIIHVKRKQGILANKSVIKRYLKQKNRGTEGFGFIEIKNGLVVGGKRSEGEKEILKALEESTADEILFHHRMPTSTPNFIESTHPIVVKHKSLKYHYYVVHNGIISNDKDLKKLHVGEGFRYTTAIKEQWITKGNVYSNEIFNDSEALAIDIAKSIENKTAMESRGSIAVIALQVDKKTKEAVALYYGRNYGNPLKVELGKDLFGISSESGKDLKSDTLYRYDYITDEITKEEKDIGKYPYHEYSRTDFDDGIPEFGHWDNNTGQWIDNGTIPKGRGVNFSDFDNGYVSTKEEIDEDFIYEWDEMIDEQELKIAEAKRNENWDLVAELRDELASMESHYADIERESGRKEELRRGSRARKMGF